MNRKIAFGLIVLALIVGMFVGTTRSPKIEPSNGVSEPSTITLRLNERYEAASLSQNFFVYSGWPGAVAYTHQITIVVKYLGGYSGGMASYPIYIKTGDVFYFGGEYFTVKKMTLETITLEIS